MGKLVTSGNWTLDKTNYIDPYNNKNLKENVCWEIDGTQTWNFHALHPEMCMKHVTDFCQNTSNTWRSVMTFAQGNLYEERAALLNITSSTANWELPKLVPQIGSENGKQNNNKTSCLCGHWLIGIAKNYPKKVQLVKNEHSSTG